MTDATTSTPRPGTLATVRSHQGLVTSVEPFDGETVGRFYLTTVEFPDADGLEEQSLIWEREPDARLTEPAALPSPPSVDLTMRALQPQNPWCDKLLVGGGISRTTDPAQEADPYE